MHLYVHTRAHMQACGHAGALKGVRLCVRARARALLLVAEYVNHELQSRSNRYASRQACWSCGDDSSVCHQKQPSAATLRFTTFITASFTVDLRTKHIAMAA